MTNCGPPDGAGVLVAFGVDVGPPGVTDAAGVPVGASSVVWQLPQFEFQSKPGVTVPQPTGSEDGQFRLNLSTCVLVGNMGIKVGVAVAC